MKNVAELCQALAPDLRREAMGWSSEFRAAQDSLLSAANDDQRCPILAHWLGTEQPCIFGKIAARGDLLQFCLLSTDDLKQSDEFIRDKIQSARRRWWREGYNGRKHGFILHVSDSVVANARPDKALLALAQRLAELYLLEASIEQDRVYLDELFLKAPGHSDDHVFRWSAGVNVFSAAGDGRWWRDHRIPGGLAFSVNSVGHMVKASQVRGGLEQLLTELRIAHETEELGKVESLEDALRFAMGTIANASDGVSGRATWLAGASEAHADDPPCPVGLGKRLEGKHHCWYYGRYHTDHTLPSVYFRDDIDRPPEASLMKLDLTYIFHDSVDNPDHITMGSGEQIRGDHASHDHTDLDVKATKRWPREGKIADFTNLIEALR